MLDATSQFNVTVQADLAANGKVKRDQLIDRWSSLAAAADRERSTSSVSCHDTRSTADAHRRRIARSQQRITTLPIVMFASPTTSSGPEPDAVASVPEAQLEGFGEQPET